MYTPVLHMLLLSFSWGSLDCSWLLYRVAEQNRLKTTGLHSKSTGINERDFKAHQQRTWESQVFKNSFISLGEWLKCDFYGKKTKNVRYFFYENCPHFVDIREISSQLTKIIKTLPNYVLWIISFNFSDIVRELKDIINPKQLPFKYDLWTQLLGGFYFQIEQLF